MLIQAIESITADPAQTVVVVGNGPYNPKKKTGEWIDQQDVVIRFNQFVTRWHEEYVGTKTTIWAWIANMGQVWMAPGDFDCVWMITRVHPLKGRKHLESFANGKPIIEIGPTAYREAAFDIGYPSDQICPTAGVIAIYWATKFWKTPVSVIGFGAYLPEKQVHYWTGRKDRRRYHRCDIEEVWLKKMVQDKKITDISELL